MPLLLSGFGVTEYYATYFRMLASAQLGASLNASHTRKIDGYVEYWALGYSGEVTPAATLFPLQLVVLVGAIIAVSVGSRTRVKRVSKFNPMDTTCLIVASAEGGRNGGLASLQAESAIRVDEDALSLRVRYTEAEGLQQESDSQGFKDLATCTGTG